MLLLCLHGIGATISTTSQAIGSAISSFMLHCNGSETNPDDCVVESPSLVTTHCQRTIIQCFITDPDPQLCNISLSTTLPEYKTIVSDHTLASTANTEAPTDHILVRHTTADTMVAKRSHKDSSNLTIISSIAVVTVMIAVLTCFASLVMICFMVKRRKEASKTEKSKQEEKESQKLFDDTSQYAVITECKQERQKERVESVHQYKKNDAYGCMPIDMQTNHFNQQIGGVVMSDDQQQDVEPVYETIPDPIRLQTE